MKNKKIFYVILIIIVLALAGIILFVFYKPTTIPISIEAKIPDINERPNIVKNYSVFTSADDAFRIQYPSGWIFRDHLRRTDGCVIYETKEKEEGLSFQSVTVIACPKASQDISENSLRDFLKEKLYTDDTKNIIITLTKDSIYKVFVFSGIYHNLKTEGEIVLYDKKSYIIKYEAELPDYNNYIGEAKKIISTFEIIKPDASSNCYCSLCTGKCIDVKYSRTEECPVPPPENYITCANNYCTFENGVCKTVPLPKW